ncbi:MAG: lipopolysaccharide heptosyltransferase II [Candidatus Omnitrophica bacterium]|nr:lipopolysaccharide heptosyltransferase II [Candidatus Omnitrophota bacterium]
MKNNYKKILIFNVNWLGDVLFSTATIRNIRRNYPESFIACIIPGGCYPILKDNPYLNEIIIFDEKDRHRGIFRKIDFIRLLKAKNFDVVFLLHRSFTRALICFLAGIPERIGYITKKRSFLLTRKIPSLSPIEFHRIDYYLNIIEKAGLRVEDRFLDFFIQPQDSEFVDRFLKENLLSDEDFLVGLNPGGNWLPKRWPKAYWAELADRLIKEFGAKVIFTGSIFDKKDIEDILGLMLQRPILTCGLFNLKQLGALCKRLKLFISADTGPLHIANTVGTRRIIALFGPTSPQVTGPYPLKNVIILKKDVGCKIPCYTVDCQDNRCMKAITVDEVLEKVRLIKND